MPEYNGNLYPHNTMNFIPPNNVYDNNAFSHNNLDNGLFSYNVDNRVNVEKRKIKKQDDSDNSYLINLDNVNINFFK